LAASQGNSYAVVPETPNVAPSTGVYSYTKKGGRRAEITANDSVMGVVWSELTFANGHGGTFRTWAKGVEQTGSFCITAADAPILAPGSLAGRTLFCSITSGTEPFESEGAYSFVTPQRGSTYVIIPETPNIAAIWGAYSYTRTGLAKGLLMLKGSDFFDVVMELTFINATGGTFRKSAGPDPQRGTFWIR
jgi:hypothetical protein